MADKKDVVERSMEFNELFTAKVNEMLKDVENKRPLYVTYDIFKQAMELSTENMKTIYNVLHEIASEKTFSIDFSVGEFNFSISGRHEDADKIIETSEKMANRLSNKLLNCERLGLLNKETKRDNDEHRKSYS